MEFNYPPKDSIEIYQHQSEELDSGTQKNQISFQKEYKKSDRKIKEDSSVLKLKKKSQNNQPLRI